MSSSAFQEYSFGRAAENKPRSTNNLLVTPIEILPLLTGELADEDEDLEAKGVDADGNEWQLTITTGTTLRCKWLQWGSNRATAPDIRRGERVIVYRFGNSPDFYWVSTGLDEHLRRLESVVYLWSADPEGTKDNERTAENCYALAVSAHEKQITLTTTKANGEPFSYVFQFNLEIGNVSLEDDIGNFWQMDSAENVHTFQNADKTELRLDKQDIFFNATRNYTATVGETYTVNCTDYILNAKNSVTIDTVSYKATATEKYDVVTNKATITAPETEITGNLTVGGNAGIGGKITASSGEIGGVKFNSGAIECKTLTASQPISAPNV